MTLRSVVGTTVASPGATNRSSRKGKRQMKKFTLMLLGMLFAFSTLTGCPPAADDDDSAAGDDDSAM